MRKLTYGINLSIDGCCDHTKFGGGVEMLEYFGQLMQDVDLIVYGRKTYELMVPYWPEIARNPTDETKEEIEYAKIFDSINKIVFSRTLDSVKDNNSRIARTNLKEEILKLKQEQGKNISVGGVDLPSQLMELNLIDEYHFVIHPVLVGEGTRLLEGISLPEKLELKFVDSKTFKSGAVALRYLKNS